MSFILASAEAGPGCRLVLLYRGDGTYATALLERGSLSEVHSHRLAGGAHDDFRARLAELCPRCRAPTRGKRCELCRGFEGEDYP